MKNSVFVDLHRSVPAAALQLLWQELLSFVFGQPTRLLLCRDGESCQFLAEGFQRENRENLITKDLELIKNISLFYFLYYKIYK